MCFIDFGTASKLTSLSVCCVYFVPIKCSSREHEFNYVPVQFVLLVFWYCCCLHLLAAEVICLLFYYTRLWNVWMLFFFFWQTIFRHVASSPILINIIPYFKKLRKYACKRKTCRLHLAWQIFYAHRRIIMYPSYVHTYRQWEESSFEFKG